MQKPTSDKSSRSCWRTTSQNIRKHSLVRFLWFHFISSSFCWAPFCENRENCIFQELERNLVVFKMSGKSTRPSSSKLVAFESRWQLTSVIDSSASISAKNSQELLAIFKKFATRHRQMDWLDIWRRYLAAGPSTFSSHFEKLRCFVFDCN